MKKHSKIVLISILVILSTIVYILVNRGTFGINDNELERSINNPNSTSQSLKVLVIEINPLLNTITDPSLFSNNNGHPKVSEYFNQDADAALNEVIKDFEDTSHNYLDVTITDRIWLNEFPTYSKEVTLKNGNKANKFDEETYLNYANCGSASTCTWYNIYSGGIFDNGENYIFDYDYIINKYDLVQKRNNGDFDQVWLLTIDPSKTFETTMVGRNPYFINGTGIEKDCDNFMFANITIARRDSNFHAMGHAMENIIRKSFGIIKDDYSKDVYNVNSIRDYYSLNIVNKFFLTSYNNTKTMSPI